MLDFSQNVGRTLKLHGHCHKTTKASANNCSHCGASWEDANPYFVPPDRAKSKKQHQGQWGHSSWDYAADYGKSRGGRGHGDPSWNQQPKSPRHGRRRHGRGGQKGQQHQQQGILLLPTLAKSFHALLRKRIIRLLDTHRLPGQLGGFAQQEVLFGSQVLCILGRTAGARSFSIGVLFVDLSTAFHCLIREIR